MRDFVIIQDARQTLTALGLDDVVEQHPAKTVSKIHLAAVPSDPEAAMRALIEEGRAWLDAWCWDAKWISVTGAVDVAQRALATLGHTENQMLLPQVETVIYLQATSTSLAIAHTAFLAKKILWWGAPERGISSANPGELERTS